MDESDKIIDYIFLWAKKDSMTIIIMILVLGACAYTLYHVGDVLEKCNRDWQAQWLLANCYIPDPAVNDILFNRSLNLSVVYYDNPD